MKLRNVEYDYGTWAVRIEVGDDMAGVSAGTWRSNSPHAGGILVNAPTSAHLREIAEALLTAADGIESGDR